MMFENKHRCLSCGMIPDINTDHDHYLTFDLTTKYKTNRIIFLTLKLDKLHTLPILQDTIIHFVDKYHNNGLVDDLPKFTNLPSNYYELKQCIHLQNSIDWDHFIRGRISK